MGSKIPDNCVTWAALRSEKAELGSSVVRPGWVTEVRYKANAKSAVVLEGVGFLGRESKLEEVPSLKTCMERSFLSLCEVVGPGYRVTFERDKGHGRGNALT